MPKLKTPTQTVFLIALACLVLAMIGYFAEVPILTKYPFWLAVSGYVVLALGSIPCARCVNAGASTRYAG